MATMRRAAKIIRKLPDCIVTGDATYSLHIFGQERNDGTWEGWLEFHPADPGHPVLSTEQETSHPNRPALEYWADGLEPVYLQDAFARAQGGLL
jgi:hypothetical protein